MKLGLGTVQFGLPYGVSNAAGQPPATEVARILARAAAADIAVLDTAAAYGNAEAALGQCLGPDHKFAIITKAASPGPGAHSQQLRDSVDASLRNLRQERLYGLLLHRAADLFAPGGQQLVTALRELVAAGRVAKIGVSVYTAEEIDRTLDIFTPDIVQLPISILDQRLLASGHLRKLKAAGVEIHARSIFLQGLLLMDAVPTHFHPLQAHLARYAEFLARNGLTRVQAALSFIAAVPDVDVALVGVTGVAELDEILASMDRFDGCAEDFSAFAVTDERMVNPALWDL